jgi:cobalamin biosynthesis Mg chelatase CobN
MTELHTSAESETDAHQAVADDTIETPRSEAQRQEQEGTHGTPRLDPSTSQPLIVKHSKSSERASAKKSSSHKEHRDKEKKVSGSSTAKSGSSAQPTSATEGHGEEALKVDHLKGSRDRKGRYVIVIITIIVIVIVIIIIIIHFIICIVQRVSRGMIIYSNVVNRIVAL